MVIILNTIILLFEIAVGWTNSNNYLIVIIFNNKLGKIYNLLILFKSGLFLLLGYLVYLFVII